MLRTRARQSGLALAALSLAALSLVGGAARGTAHAAPVFHPTVSDYAQLTSSTTPPTESQCESAGRRCFTPQSVRAAYNLAPLYSSGLDGTGVTIAVVDSFGSDTITHDLHVYDQAFGLPPLCGEEGVTCAPGMPTFSQYHFENAAPPTKAGPGKSPGQEDRSAWAIETSLDVETAHAIAPGANILLVTTPTAETLGVQGLPPMMAAEQYVIDNHLADVISQSFGTAEDAFSSTASLQNLRYAFVSAKQHNVTVLASSGDFGSAGVLKQPVGGPNAQPLLPNPTVGWPASDPLVTGVGGTYLCTDPTSTTTRTVDSVDPPTNCQNNPGQAEVGWIDSGGGFSHVFTRPGFQDTLPAGSTAIPPTARGVPDIGLQASARTGALVYVSLPGPGDSGLFCGNSPCSTGWYDIGGTSLSCPQWAGIVAIADQANGGRLGYINPALYAMAADPSRYANDFYDVTVGNNGAFAPTVPGYSASPGWDPVTGLGTPNAAQLVPDLVAAVHSS